MKRIELIVKSFVVACLLACAATASAQEPVLLKDRAVFRDAVLDAGAGRAFVTAYDRNQVWAVDLKTGAKLAEVNVGHGPAALAQDGWALACVNRLDNTVSIIRLPGLEVTNTVKVGDGPVAIAATGGKFYVANAFSDSLSVIDAGTGAVTENKDVPAVPSMIAASGGYVAVCGNGASSVRILAPGGGSRNVVVDAPVQGLAVGPDGYFMVGTMTSLNVIELATEKLSTATGSFDGLTMQKIAARVYQPAATSGFQRVLSLNLPETAYDGATRLISGDGVLLVLSAPARTARVYPLVATPTPPALPSTETVAAGKAPVVEAQPVVEAKPVEVAKPSEPAPAPAPVVEAQPVTPAPAPETKVAEATPPAAAPAPAPAPKPEPQHAGATPVLTPEVNKDAAAAVPATPNIMAGYRENPIRTEGIRAPTPGRAPGVNPLERVTRRRISDAISQPTEFGNIQQGFKPPDYTQALRDVQADEMTQELNSDVTHMQGNVRLKMGDMDFTADGFDYSQQQGNFAAKGNVVINQVNSNLTADELIYKVPSKEDFQLKVSPSIFKPAADAQDIENQRMQQGHLNAMKLHIVEPTRTITADNVDYDFATGTGTLTNAYGRADIWYYNAQTLHILGPASADGKDVWVTTCDHNPPHYRIRMNDFSTDGAGAYKVKDAQLRIGGIGTPFFLPAYSNGIGRSDWSMDFDTGNLAKLGFYTNLGQSFTVSPQLSMGPRIFATVKDGIGLGLDASYDYTGKPASRLYMNQGEFHALYNTEERGYLHWYNRWEANDDLVVRLQVEQWDDRDIYKDYYFHEYRNRTEPRTFAAVTYRQPGYIAEGVVQPDTQSWERETERLPEASFYLLERPIYNHLYVAFDTVNGYNDRQPAGGAGVRTANTARLSYDLNLGTFLNVMPFLELQDTWYSDRRFTDEAGNRFSPLVGLNLQTRLQRTFGGALGFSGFKHIILPSLTYSYRPGSSLGIEDTPRFDALDNGFGLSRIETKLDNLFYGKDAETGQTWQVGRVSLYQGNDFSNEISRAQDYAAEIDIRPRPWWGYELTAERHAIDNQFDLTSQSGLTQYFLQRYEETFNQPFDPRNANFDVRYGDYNRLLTQLYYDNTPLGGIWSARLGFAYTSTQGNTYNREVLYGAGVKLGQNWSVAFEHRYDFEDNRLRYQTYEIRRRLHCWETGLMFRERESGFDVNLTFNIAAFPGSKFKI